MPLAEIEYISYAALIVAGKMHQHATGCRIVRSFANYMGVDGEALKKAELELCKGLRWLCSPVTSFEFLPLLVMYSAADGPTLKMLIAHGLRLIGLFMGEYAALKFSPLVIAVSALHHAHQIVNESPEQWLLALAELDLRFTEDAGECFAVMQANTGAPRSSAIVTSTEPTPIQVPVTPSPSHGERTRPTASQTPSTSPDKRRLQLAVPGAMSCPKVVKTSAPPLKRQRHTEL